MKHLIIGVLILWAFLALSSLLWTSKGQPPGATLTRLLEPPQQRLASPYENGYFYLLGFAAAASLDPAKVGHEIWLETTADPSARNLTHDKPGRWELQIQLPMEQVLSSWISESPESDFLNLRAQLQTLTGRDRILLTRYERWLAMPFEDMGFGHQATPRFVEIFVGHRLYVADGFSRQMALGMQRLKQDIHIWRHVLRDATTIATKVMAQIVITDDLRQLSTLLSQPAVNKTVMAMIPDMAPPLTAEESSLRWPLQHQFTLGLHGKHPGEGNTDGQAQSLDTYTQWLTIAAHLPKQAFHQITHPPERSFLGVPLPIQGTWDMYAQYYDAMIHATESGQSALPTLHALGATTHQGIVESLANPTPFEPDWGPFQSQLRETDARLRLASLQIVLRRPSAQITVPNRLAQVGSAYYDPFSGLPMLWSPTQQKIYRVGKDRYDDGGDSSFDISVPGIISTTPEHNASQVAAPTSRPHRHYPR